MSIIGNIVKSVKRGADKVKSSANPPSQYERMIQRGEDYRKQLRKGGSSK